MEIQKQLDQITSPEISNVISEGLASVFNARPNFPVTYLAEWLNSYSASQKRKKELISSKAAKLQKFNQIQVMKAQLQQAEKQKVQELKKKTEQKDQTYQDRIFQTKHLEDLLEESMPQFIEKTYGMTGAYVGKLDFNKKQIEEGNFELGAQNDTENPKVIRYIGASKSHKDLMIGLFLPNGKGVSYDVFEQKPQEANEQGAQQAANAQQKKPYLYVSNVMKQPRLHYFKYPKLGSYACYPIKVKSCLSIPTLDKGIVDYKAYLKTKEETEKEYNQKVTETKTEADEAMKKFEDFELNQEDPASHQQKTALENEAKAADEKLQEILKNPPSVEQVKFDTIQKNFFLATDRLGQDKDIQEETLSAIDQKVKFFVSQWEQKQHKMLLTDILTFLEEEPQLQALENLFQENEKNLMSTYEPQIKEQFANKQKEAEFELSLIKCEKIRQLLNEPQFKASMEVYLNYNVPKFTELIQIWCMLLGIPKNEINLPQSNQLHYRKIINAASFKDLFEKLQAYELRRQSSEPVSSDYKINKLLERLQKIDQQALAKYNGFLFVLHHLIKTTCWTRIFCRDAKKQLFETKTKQKEDRDNEIQKWLTDIEKSLETAMTELDEEGKQNFNQEEWRKNYQTQTPKPQPLEAPVFKEFLDIE